MAAAAMVSVAVAYVLCTLVVAYYPNMARTIFENVFHIIGNFRAAPISAMSLSIGFVVVVALSGISAAFFALLYNACVLHCMRIRRF